MRSNMSCCMLAIGGTLPAEVCARAGAAISAHRPSQAGFILFSRSSLPLSRDAWAPGDDTAGAELIADHRQSGDLLREIADGYFAAATQVDGLRLAIAESWLIRYIAKSVVRARRHFYALAHGQRNRPAIGLHKRLDRSEYGKTV